MDGDSAQVETTAGHVKSAQPSQRGGFRSGGRGGHQPKSTWWTDYYDPSTNVNPWERLEQERGLQPRGPWMTWDEAKAKA
ncbi:hypothetical protein MN608_01425 [Microdochium nivale]|nr:hypothetical protein MN608_01425 [Microdochium nivale]